GSVKATYASDRPCLRVSAVYSGRREKGNNGQEMGRTGGAKNIPSGKQQRTSGKKAKHFQTNKRGYENAF
ncbi:hypothetical protein, partial [Bacteroides sp.]|uniref:hypothetical protein n=1 Tax=Bacteroides sp. TaxID=29523 RepID=UPI002A7FB6BA